MSSDTAGNERGFTLVELLVVMLISGIMLTCSFVSLQHGMPAHQLRSASSKLASELRLVRQKAVAQNNNFVVTFDPSADAYTLWDDDGSDGYRSSGEQIRVVSLPTGVQLGTISIGSSNTVTFRSNGSCDRGGYVDLRGENSLCRRVNIVRATAAVSEEKVD